MRYSALAPGQGTLIWRPHLHTLDVAYYTNLFAITHAVYLQELSQLQREAERTNGFVLKAVEAFVGDCTAKARPESLGLTHP